MIDRLHQLNKNKLNHRHHAHPPYQHSRRAHRRRSWRKNLSMAMQRTASHQLQNEGHRIDHQLISYRQIRIIDRNRFPMAGLLTSYQLEDEGHRTAQNRFLMNGDQSLIIDRSKSIVDHRSAIQAVRRVIRAAAAAALLLHRRRNRSSEGAATMSEYHLQENSNDE